MAQENIIFGNWDLVAQDVKIGDHDSDIDLFAVNEVDCFDCQEAEILMQAIEEMI
jgi:hypothetical protein